MESKRLLTEEENAFLRQEMGLTAPRKSISALIEHFEKSKDLIISIGAHDLFELMKIEAHPLRDMRCLCGRPIKTMYIIGHKSAHIQLGLGSECIKYFFKDLTEAKVKKALSAYEAHCKAIEEVLNGPVPYEEKELLQARAFGLIGAKFERRLEFGLPLTLAEWATINHKLHLEARREVHAHYRVARGLLAPYKDATLPEDFQYVVALLKDGTAITDIETLLKRAFTDFATKKVMENYKVNTIIQPANQRPRLNVSNRASESPLYLKVERAIQSIAISKDQLSTKGQQNFEQLQQQLSMQLTTSVESYRDALCALHTRQLLEGLCDQLGLRFHLLH